VAVDRPAKISDPALRDAVRRLDEHTRTLGRRVADAKRATDSVERGLMMMEAEVAASLVRSATCEVALRLLPHGITWDAEKDALHRTRHFRVALAELEATSGPLIRA
jgi:hypothetical protein